MLDSTTGQTEECDEISGELASSLLEAIDVVEDPRDARGRRYPLREVLMITIVGCMCGCDHAEALEDWAKKEREWLGQHLELNHGTPSQDVFLRVLAAIDVEQFRTSFLSWVQMAFAPLGIGEQIAVDGQTHRGSGHRGTDKSPVHMVSAFACQTGLVLGQVATAEKSNEIKAIPILLEMLDLEGALVSIDAMGTQRRIMQVIRNKGGDYLLAIKENQPLLYEQVVDVFKAAKLGKSKNIDEADPPKIQTHCSVDGGHGRIETRTASVMHDFASWVPATGNWWNVKSLILIESTREDMTSGNTESEARYYFSSRELTAEQANEAVRTHWHVENKLHWVLDVSFGQDHCQIRTENAAENLATVRQFVLNLIRSYSGDKYSVPRRRRLCDYDPEYRDRLLAETASL